MKSFEQVLDLVSELSLEQRDLLVDIVQRRAIQEHRHELAITSKEALEEYRSGKLKPQSAQTVIDELQDCLNHDLD